MFFHIKLPLCGIELVLVSNPLGLSMLYFYLFTHCISQISEPVCSNKGGTVGMAGMKQGKASTVQPIWPEDQLLGASNSECGIPFEKSKELEVNLNVDGSSRATVKPEKQSQFSALDGKDKDQRKTQLQSCKEIQNLKSPGVFKGKLFQFSSSFPPDRVSLVLYIGYVNTFCITFMTYQFGPEGDFKDFKLLKVFL